MKTKWYHIALFFGIVAWAMMCNTDSLSFMKPKEKQWAFLDSTLLITAKPKGIVEGAEVYKQLNIKQNDELIYTNDKLIFLNHNDILPICRSLANKQMECLMAFKEKRGDKMLRVQFNTHQTTKIDTLPLLSFDYKDVDNDGIIEMSGFTHTKLTYCFNCDSVYYNPKLYYEMTHNGFKLDSLATKNWINRNYSSFHGYEVNMNIAVKLIEIKP